MSNQELKPCPFCGSRNLAVYFEFVECLDCQATGSAIDQANSVADDLDPNDVTSAARKAWNHRPLEQPRATLQQPTEYHGGLGDK